MVTCTSSSLRLLALFAIVIATTAGAACGKSKDGKSKVLRLATTTSTRDSGLLDSLVPLFEKQQRCRVDVIAVGTGKAIKLGSAGDVDVVLVHARAAEEAFMAAGHGARRENVMYNNFEILGPADDPAAIKSEEATAALAKIAAGGHRFVSRGDDSGTHKRELSLWKSAGGRPEWKDYIDVGQGMGATLTMADEMRAYVLVDRGTYLKFRAKIDLVPLARVTEILHNPYGIMTVNPAKHTAINADLANAFVDFMISPPARQLIAEYRVEGEQLFHPHE